MNKVKHLILLICVFTIGSFIPNTVFGQDIFLTAKADAKEIFLGTAVEVTFTMHNTNNGNFRAPIFRGFDIISGPMHAMSTQIINGKVTKEQSYAYTLEPKQIGKLRIEAAKLIVRGKTYKSKPFAINILKRKGSKAKNKTDLAKENGTEFFVLAEIDTTDIYLGQQVILNYKLYTKVTIESYRTLSEPAYADFFMSDVRRFSQDNRSEIYQGEQYRTKTLKKLALFPQKSGILKIGSAKFQLGIPINNGKASRGFFSFRQTKSVYSTTKPIELLVNPLPETKEPSFSGAVGQFVMNSRVNKRRMSTDDAVAIKMHIEGTGDIKTLKAPDMILSDSFEVYEPTVISESNFDQNGLFLCTKEFEYMVLPKYPGDYTLTPKFTYFNTDSLRYITIANQSFPLHVIQGTHSKKAIVPKSQQETTAKLSDILPSTNLYKKSKPFYGTTPFWVLLGLPFIGLIGTFFYNQQQLKKDNVDVSVKKSNMAEQVATEKLKSAKTYLNNKDARSFYDEVAQSMFGYIGDKLKMKGSELDKKEIRLKMEHLGISTSNIDDFIDILKKCELALFAGMANESDMGKTYNKALDVVSKIEKSLTVS